MIDFDVNRFHFMRGVPLKCFFTFKLPKKSDLSSGRFFYFGLISGYCVIFLVF